MAKLRSVCDPVLGVDVPAQFRRRPDEQSHLMEARRPRWSQEPPSFDSDGRRSAGNPVLRQRSQAASEQVSRYRWWPTRISGHWQSLPSWVCRACAGPRRLYPARDRVWNSEEAERESHLAGNTGAHWSRRTAETTSLLGMEPKPPRLHPFLRHSAQDLPTDA